ncbi:MAG TPA: carboxypeptidase-like regulatory domain-containing protein [Anaerolineales bacterium]|nr:carboxypeptidase-like regulatory domain-containing protein [Anaerolineales bacterium]
MKSKLVAGILAILAIGLGLWLIYFSGKKSGWFSTPTPLPTRTRTPTAPPTGTGTPTTTTTPTVTTFRAGDLGWGRVAGKVVDGANGNPVMGALVSCSQVSYFPQVLCDGQTVTGADGSFAFDPVFFHDTDTITVQVKAPGYAAQTVQTNFFNMPGMSVNFELVPATPTFTPTVTGTATPILMCTPPACAIGTSETYTCTSGNCPGGCGTACATYTPTP